METTWNTSRTSQNFQTRTRQWRTPLCAKRRTKSASSMFLRAAFIALLAFPVIAKASEQDLTSKGQDDGPLVPGRDEETLVDESADGRGDFEEGVVPADGVDAIQFLQDLAESGEKNIGGRGGGEGGGGGRTKMAAKRKWSNNEYLRVWGKRNDALRKLSNQDSARDSSFQKELLRDRGDRPSRDAAVLVLLGGMRRPGDGSRGRSPGLAQLEEEVAGKSGSGFQVIDAREFGPRILGMGTGIPRPDEAREKRKWERNSLRIWGKRDEANPGSSSSLSDYTNMRRRKWENLPLRVWGK